MSLFRKTNPSKCNDGSFSASEAKRGTCTWHQGVKGSVTQAEYDQAKKVVKHKKPKDHKGKIASSTYKRTPQASREPVEEKIIFQVDKNSFNEQYKDLQYKDNDVLKIAIALTLEEWDVLSVGSHKSFLDKDNSATLTDLKTIATNDLLPFIEEQAKSEKELGSLISDYFEMVAKNISKANKIIETNLNEEAKRQKKSKPLKINLKQFDERYYTIPNFSSYDGNVVRDSIAKALYHLDFLKKSDLGTIGLFYTLGDIKKKVVKEVIPQWEKLAQNEAELQGFTDQYFAEIGADLPDIEVEQDQSKVPTVVWSKNSTSEELIPQLVVLDEWGQRNDIANITGSLRSDYLMAYLNPVKTLLKEWLEENYTRFTNTKQIDLNRVFNFFMSEVITPFAPNTTSSGLKSQIYNNKDAWFIPKIKSEIQSLQKKELAKSKRTLTDLEETVSKALKKVNARKNKIHKAVHSTEQFKKIGGLAKFGSAPVEESLASEGQRLLTLLESKMSPYSKDEKMIMVDRYIQSVDALLSKPI